MKFLAIDLGASNGRTIVGTIGDDTIELEETHRFPNAICDGADGKRWDFDGFYSEIIAGIEKSGPVDGMGVDSWGVDYGLIDAHGDLLYPPFAYRDPGREKAMPEVFSRISSERIYEIAGIQEMPLNSIFQLMSDRLHRPEALDAADRFLMIADLVAHRLTGAPLNEYTNCTTTNILDATTRTWSDEIIDALELPRRIFGDIQEPGTRAGEYRGIPVYLPASHDTGSAVAAVPAEPGDDWAFLSSGTWALLGAEIDRPILGDAARAANFTNEGGTHGRIRFLKNITGLWLIQECQRMWAANGDPISFADIAVAAADAADFPSVIDPNDNRFMAPDNMLEAVAAACAESGQPVPASIGQTARCCYQSVAVACADNLKLLEKVTERSFSRLHIVGGGTQATLLNQLTADACGIPVIAGPVEATAIGNICVQAMGHGLFSGLDDMRRRIARSFPLQTYEPH